eukprot:Amastigsp_a3862_15.p2 type:complete len:228 gc:universal Amastigsp_a3862_15:230-913(+)
MACGVLASCLRRNEPHGPGRSWALRHGLPCRCERGARVAERHIRGALARLRLGVEYSCGTGARRRKQQTHGGLASGRGCVDKRADRPDCRLVAGHGAALLAARALAEALCRRGALCAALDPVAVAEPNVPDAPGVLSNNRCRSASARGQRNIRRRQSRGQSASCLRDPWPLGRAGLCRLAAGDDALAVAHARGVLRLRFRVVTCPRLNVVGMDSRCVLPRTASSVSP